MTHIKITATPRFWRDDALEFIEARSIEDGRSIHYDRHAHATFSIGAITAGSCIYLNGRTRQRVSAGSVVLMNPGDVHACNPIGDERWSYRMLYVDVPWLAAIQQEVGITRDRFLPFLTVATTQRRLFTGLNRLYEVLIDGEAEALEKHEATVMFMMAAQLSLISRQEPDTCTPRGIARAADFIRENFKRPLRLREICSAADLSPSYLIRAFKREYGMTPHAYVVNCRIEFSRAQLRKGLPISAVACEAGFADQAHLQRMFKRIVAATPAQYRA
jgi:AraC-like DNA-binding protein